MQRDKKGKFVKGFKPWNTGKRINLDLFNIHRRHWYNGESILDISKELGVSDGIIRLRLKENNYKIRPKEELTKNTRNKIKESQFKKGKAPWNKGIKGKTGGWNKNKKLEDTYSKETAERLHKQLINNRKNQIFPLKDTSIEIKIRDFLDKLGIKYIQHKYLGEIRHAYQCDFYLPIQEGIKKVTIIECLGCYWHGCEKCMKELNNKQNKQRHKDNKRTYELIGKGYDVLNLWEHDIKDLTLKQLKGQVFK